MIERRRRAGLLHKARGTVGTGKPPGVQQLDGDFAPQARVARLVHFAHAARSDQREDLVRAESSASGKRHRC